MSKTLKVIEAFAMMEPGDKFELSEDGKTYSCSLNMDWTADEDFAKTVYSKYASQYTISAAYAEVLVKEGYLEPVDAPESNFINVFDEINTLKAKYAKELDDVNSDTYDFPECLKVEKRTVLTNMITLLDHLSSLKK